MSDPVTITLDSAAAEWLRSMVTHSSWSGLHSDIVTRVREALATALGDDDDDAHAMMPQERIGASEFLDM